MPVCLFSAIFYRTRLENVNVCRVSRSRYSENNEVWAKCAGSRSVFEMSMPETRHLAPMPSADQRHGLSQTSNISLLCNPIFVPISLLHRSIRLLTGATDCHDRVDKMLAIFVSCYLLLLVPILQLEMLVLRGPNLQLTVYEIRSDRRLIESATLPTDLLMTTLPEHQSLTASL